MRIGLLFLAVAFSSSVAAESRCFGTTSNGRLEAGCKLPASGENFTTYSHVLRLIGRTYVHCEVQRVLIDAYDSLRQSHPEKIFVYGETGKREGGPFPPHRTHQNGLSVDFMSPILDENGRSIPLPTNPLNRYGYDIDFTLSGQHDDFEIDFEAIAAHLAAIKMASEAAGVKIWRVIFDPEMRPSLMSTSAWSEISSLNFTKKRSWVRHDDHYHVDFDIPCQPM